MRPGRRVGFVQRYGWRAYALPILSVVTVVALVQSGTTLVAGRGSAQSAPGVSPRPSVQGATRGEAGFAAGATPAPVVVHLGDDGVSCATNTYGKLLLVSISRQRLWACAGARQVDETAVTTGARAHDDATPLGSWRVQAKQRDRYLVGPGYKEYVRYWVPFNGDFGLHDASWQTMPFGSKDWPTKGSHGCVHVPIDVMAWIYAWVGVGSTVVTVES